MLLGPINGPRYSYITKVQATHNRERKIFKGQAKRKIFKGQGGRIIEFKELLKHAKRNT